MRLFLSIIFLCLLAVGGGLPLISVSAVTSTAPTSSLPALETSGTDGSGARVDQTRTEGDGSYERGIVEDVVLREQKNETGGTQIEVYRVRFVRFEKGRTKEIANQVDLTVRDPTTQRGQGGYFCSARCRRRDSLLYP